MEIKMAKITNPASLSNSYGISPKQLSDLGIVDVMLATDTLLFIDPMLLSESQHKEMNEGAHFHYEERFNLIVKLLSKVTNKNDACWKAAEKKFKFSEVSNTCLGYGTSVNGSGFGPELIAATIDTAYQIVSLGVDDTDLFMVLALFEDGIGPDRISDMTTNIILDDLVDFTTRVNETLKLPTREYKINNQVYNLIINNVTDDGLILVPSDVVRDLPIASDWSDIGRVARENEKLREDLNSQVGGIWTTMTRKQKKTAKEAALKSKEAFETVLELIKMVSPEPYDFDKDRNGETFWTNVISYLNVEHPFDLSQFKNRKLSIEEVDDIVNKILDQFKDLIENKGLWKELWSEEDKPRKEKAAQRLLFAVAYSYCVANDLDLSPEADSGNGPVDFKVSQGFKGKVVVEIKLSTNGSLVHGYEKQLEIYKRADDTEFGYFLLIDVGSLGKKYLRVQNLRSEFLAENKRASKIVYIDGNQKASASIRT